MNAEELFKSWKSAWKIYYRYYRKHHDLDIRYTVFNTRRSTSGIKQELKIKSGYYSRREMAAGK